MPDADRFVPLDPDMGDAEVVIDSATGWVADPEAVRLHEMECECERLTQQVRALEVQESSDG